MDKTSFSFKKGKHIRLSLLSFTVGVSAGSLSKPQICLEEVGLSRSALTLTLTEAELLTLKASPCAHS